MADEPPDRTSAAPRAAETIPRWEETPERPKDPAAGATPATDAIDDLHRHANRAVEHARALLRARIDLARLGVRDGAILAGLWVVGGLAFAGTLAALAIFVFLGAAQGVGLLLGGRMWAGYLIVGLLGLAGLGFATFAALRSFKAKSLKELQQRYGVANQPKSSAEDEEHDDRA